MASGSTRTLITTGVLLAVTAAAVGYSVLNVLGDRPRPYVPTTDAERFAEAVATRIDADTFPEVFVVVNEDGDGVIVRGVLPYQGDEAAFRAFLETIEPRVPVEWDLSRPW